MPGCTNWLRYVPLCSSSCSDALHMSWDHLEQAGSSTAALLRDGFILAFRLQLVQPN